MTDLIRSHRVRFGAYEADLHTCELWKFGTKVKLVGQPFAILAVLLSKAGELVTREELQERLWPGETFVDFNHGLNAAINKLRDVLCDSAEDPKFIETLPRRGYRFIAKVERERAAAEAPVPVNEAPVALPVVTAEPTPRAAELETIESAGGGGSRSDHGLSRVLLGVLAGALLLVAFGVFLVLAKGRRPAEVSYALSPNVKGAQRILAYGGKNEGPQFSADGKRVVFMSDRDGGDRNLWICNADGSDAHPITALGDAGTPRWSPDGETIAYDTHIHKYSAILLVSAQGGTPRIAVAGDANNAVPSWSRDGKTLYFASDRTGRYEVWKMPVGGGEPTQLTHDGGFSGFESEDGKFFYYARNQFPGPEIWRIAVQGGGDEPVLPPARSSTWASWGIAGDHLYYVDQGLGDVALLSEVDLKTQRTRQVTMLGRFPFWLAVSPDGNKVLFDRSDTETSTSLVELEDFR